MELWHIMCHNGPIERINLRELRDTARLKAALGRGTPVELYERSRLLGTVVPAPGPLNERWPDFAALNQAIFGGRVLSGADILAEIRRG